LVIVQLFNQTFAQVEKALPRLTRLGLSHVLISPPQKSHASRSWWGRYQPVDFRRIEGPLGNQAQLQSLCRAAQGKGLTVLADAVLHHLSNESRYLRCRGRRIEAAQYPHFSTPDFKGIHRPGRGRGLPILNTDSSWVRGQLRDYLHWLHHLGVGGFRFDSAKHLDPHLFPQLLAGLPPLLNLGELVYARPQDFPQAYWQSMKAYDFPLAHCLKRAFAPGGDLGSLVQPTSLWGPLSIPFVNHHDLMRNRSGFAHFRIDNLRDLQLAYVYLLGRPEGIPLVYGSDLRHPEVKAGLQFHRHCLRLGLGLEWVAASRTQLAWRRGTRALGAINKGTHGWRLEARLEPGLYRDLISGSRLRLGSMLLVAPRSAVLLVPDG
jgi:alpha-amylase